MTNENGMPRAGIEAVQSRGLAGTSGGEGPSIQLLEGLKAGIQPVETTPAVAAVAARRPLRIYVASSWRNARHPSVVETLRAAGHEVYDFRNPPNRSGFAWRQVSEKAPGDWTPADWVTALEHPVAIAGFDADMGALRWCDVCVLVLPCGRSAHLELGWATGAGKRTFVLAAEELDEPELMVKMCDGICLSLEHFLAQLSCWGVQDTPPHPTTRTEPSRLTVSSTFESGARHE